MYKYKGDNNMNQEGGKLFEGFRRLNKLKRLNLCK